jgi:uncharacterized protein (TIGR00255 family)
MSISSMTGFARAGGGAGARAWSWEARSVNGRGLDLRLRLPGGHDAIEPAARAAAAERFQRGSLTLSLTLVEAPEGAAWRINDAALDNAVEAVRRLKQRLPEAVVSADGLLALRGVLETGEPAEGDEERAAREAAMLASLAQARDALRRARREEGRRLQDLLERQLEAIAGFASEARATAATQPAALKARLRDQVAMLLETSPPLSEERLAQEAALLAVRADVREELDRLDAHVAAARELIAAGGAVGRRLDFMAQEFNREANTLCSKSSDVALTRIGLELKAAIDQFREQAANVE